MLVSAGKVPKSFTFPKKWSNITTWARGTMLKSPGVGVIFTGTNDNETITLEFVKELTDLETILTLEKNILISIDDNLEMPQINFSSTYALAEQKSSSEKVSQTLKQVKQIHHNSISYKEMPLPVNQYRKKK